jgi:hypothetical protein
MIILLASKSAAAASVFRECAHHLIKIDASSNLSAILQKTSELDIDPRITGSAWKKEPACLVLDRAGISGKKYDKLLNELSKTRGICWAVLDRQGQIDDPAWLFFLGASDYLSQSAAAAGTDKSRFEQIEALFLARLHGKEENKKPGEIRRTVKSSTIGKSGKSGKTVKESEPASDFPGWSKIKEEREYEFLFLYADLPEAESIRKVLGEKRYVKIKEDFINSINSLVKQVDGKIWMINGHSVLSLLPPANADRAFLLFIETLLGSSLFIYEKLGLTSPTALSFSFHCGKSLWQQPGKTGHIISEDVNFIHHLGHKYAGKNLIYVSDKAYNLISGTGRHFLKQKGVFENHTIYCSKKFGCCRFTG